MEKIRKTLNLKETNELFEKNSVLIAGRDVFPHKVAVELFGKKITDVSTLVGGNDWNYNEIRYLYKNGLYNVVSRHNIEILKRQKNNP